MTSMKPDLQSIIATNSLMATYESLVYRTDKGHTHGHIEAYGELLKHYQHQPITVCEVGVAAGASLHLWDHYFTHPDTVIYGVDICLSVGHTEYDAIIPALSSRVKLIQADVNLLGQTQLDNVRFDFVLDDGNHVLQYQINFLKFFLPRLKPQGIAIVEDILPDDWCNPNVPHQPDATKNANVFALLQEAPGAIVIDNRRKPRFPEWGGGIWSEAAIAIAYRNV